MIARVLIIAMLSLGATVASALIIAQHYSNIRRLLSGTESKVGKKKSEVRSQKSEA